MNMSYCRFQNTLQNLIDCNNNLPNNNLVSDEAIAFMELVELCKSISRKYQEYNYEELVDLSIQIY